MIFGDSLRKAYALGAYVHSQAARSRRARLLVALVPLGLTAAACASGTMGGRLSTELGGDGAVAADMAAAEKLAAGAPAGSAAAGAGSAEGAPVQDDNAGADDGQDPGEAPADQPPLVTMPGFRMLASGGSRVFVMLSHRTKITENEAPAVLRYRLRDAAVPEKVNRLGLPTTHFLTPVGRVRIEPLEEGGAELVVELRATTAHKTKLRKSSRGTMLSVDFPPVTPAELEANAITPPPEEPEKDVKKKRGAKQAAPKAAQKSAAATTATLKTDATPETTAESKPKD